MRRNCQSAFSHTVSISVPVPLNTEGYYSLHYGIGTLDTDILEGQDLL